MKLLPFSLLLLLYLKSSLACKYKFIHNASELFQFSNDVNSGTSYSGYTVYLVNDITFNQELSKQFNPIGDDLNYFNGTFDGQGYVISDLKTSSSLWSAGLFGYSGGLTIKNVIIGDSCSITNSGSNGDHPSGPLIGGIIGYCCSTDGVPCITENCVNMGNITYKGNSDNLYVAGIAGGFGIVTDGYQGKIMNCVNYGTIYVSGKITRYIDIGGIVGELSKVTSYSVNYVFNCLNYGTVINEATGSTYYIGGIDGHSHGSTIENCLNVGTISSIGGTVGGIIGGGGSSYGYTTTLTHCYWTGSTYYRGFTTNLNAPSVYQISSMSSTYADNMNNYVSTNDRQNEWTFNQDSVKITFVMHDGKGFSYSSQLTLLPEPVRRGYSFLFWCVNENTTEGCKAKYDRTKTSDFTLETILYAQWTANNCTVNFDVNGGHDLPENERNITTMFNQKIGELPVVSRRGYTFTGWFTVGDDFITNESLVNDVCTALSMLTGFLKVSL